MDESPNCAKSEPPPAVLFGLGFTTGRLARRLLVRGGPVYAVVRDPARFLSLAALGVRFSPPPRGAVLVHTVPPLPPAENEALRGAVAALEPARVVYISSTGVYGDQVEVTAETEAAPTDEKGELRVNEETWLAGRFPQAISIRPAAIYGPGRGIHSRVLKGESSRAAAAGIVSRIHVDDLAAVVERAVFSDLEGAWPLADDYACPSQEIAEYSARLLRLPPPERPDSARPRQGRSVDGTQIRRRLGVSLAYPTYHSGVLASLCEVRA